MRHSVVSALFVLLIFITFSAGAAGSEGNDPRRVAEQICSAMINRDPAGFFDNVSSDRNQQFVSAWTKNFESGDLATVPVRKCTVRQVFDDSDGIGVRVFLERVDAKTNQPVNSYTLNHHYWFFRPENGDLRLTYTLPAEEILISRLVAAKNLAERSALIKSEPELNTHRIMFVIVFRLQNEGRYEMTEDFFELAAWYNDEFFKGRNEPSYVNTILNVINARASNAVAAGNVSEALRLYLEAREIGQEYEQRSGGRLGGSSLVLSNVGRMYFRQGDLEQAENFALATLKSLENADRRRQEVLFKSTYQLLADIYSLRKDYGKALEYYRLHGDDLRHGEASVLYRLGKSEDAAAIYQRTLEIHAGNEAKKMEVSLPVGVEASVMMAEIERNSERYEKAILFAEKAVSYALRSKNPALIYSAKTAHGKALAALGKKVEAEAAFLESINTVEKGRLEALGSTEHQVEYFGDRIEPYHLLTQSLIERNEDWKALEMIEQSRARVLSDIMRSERITFASVLTGTDKSRESWLREALIRANRDIVILRTAPVVDKKKIDALTSEVDRLRREYEFLETTAFAKYPELRRARGNVDLVTREQINDLVVNRGSTIVEFALIQNRAYAFVIRPGGEGEAILNLIKLDKTADEIKRMAGEFRKTVAAQDLGYRESARRLFDTLIAPLNLPAAAKKVTIIPDGALWEVPFAALVDAEGKFWIEGPEINFAHSLTTLREQNSLSKERVNRKNSVFAIGNPSLDDAVSKSIKARYRDRLGDLPEAEVEVAEIAKLYGRDSKILTRSAASESAWKSVAKDYRILHFATHGVANSTRPLYSYLNLAPSATDVGEDGILEAREIVQMGLNAEIAVLSACDTAAGPAKTGEGVIGLTWAFAVSGVPTVVSSQWKVESKATSDLMIDFYRHLRDSKPSTVSSALRRAMLKQIKSPTRRHPFYWAPFVVVGK